MTIITTGLPYANGNLHIGHLYEWFLSDTISRISQQTNNPLIWVSGDDAHGVAVLQSAIKNNLEPKIWVDKLTEKRIEKINNLQLLNKNYLSTSSQFHHKFVQQAYLKIKNKQLIEEINCLQYFYNNIPVFERDVIGNCPECKFEQYLGICENCQFNIEAGNLINPKYAPNSEPLALKEVNLDHFNWGQFRNDVKIWVENNAPESIKTKLLQDLNNLPDFWCIERGGDYFGVKIPNKEGYFYVWFEALLGYFSFAEELGYYNKNFIHIIGKDIQNFHFLRLPALCLALDLPLPQKILTHGHLVDKNKIKFSKSLGNAPDIDQWLNNFGEDIIRYYLLSNTKGKQENISISEENLIYTNNYLANTIGNTYRRLIKITNGKYNCNSFEINNYNYILNGDTSSYLGTLIEELNQLVAIIQKEKIWENGKENIAIEIFSKFLILVLKLEPFIPKSLELVCQKIKNNEEINSNDIFFNKK